MNIKENDLRDKTGKYARPITYSEFKNSLDEGYKKILAEYENSLIDFFSTLKINTFLREEFADEKIERIQKLQYTCLHFHSIIHNSYTIAGEFRDPSFMNDFQTVAKSEGFDVHDIAEQVVIQICISYVYNIEYLKREMLLLIDFEKMDLKNPERSTLAQLINHLRKLEVFQKNKFLNFLNSEKRNALAYFSF